jgi:hypothetical protein
LSGIFQILDLGKCPGAKISSIILLTSFNLCDKNKSKKYKKKTEHNIVVSRRILEVVLVAFI